ncbi:fructokinase ScrK [Streptococcus uberis]|uniref:fructokinase ScrK n=1 Tax=Streptococcus uberis TaxID=1349 RepID=UPI003D3655F1
MYASIEAGGTKFVCAIGNDNLEIIEKTQFATTTPEETLKKTIEFLKPFEKLLQSISIGSFGPIDVDKNSPTYGYITSTPKKHWSNVNLVGCLKEAFDLPIYFTTDVNASAYGEMISRQKINNLVYYTIGTGIGAGAIQDGQFVGGLGHTEAGHTYVMSHPTDIENGFTGVCPFHTGCLEGMAAGPSLEARTGIRGELISKDSPVWDVQAFYIAQAAIQATMLYRPQVIVVGGGVMAQEHMVERVRRQFESLLNGYLPVPDLKSYIVTPAIENNGSATIGNIALAKSLVKNT